MNDINNSSLSNLIIQYLPQSFKGDNSLFLIRINDVTQQDVLASLDPEMSAQLLQIKHWVFHYLMRPHHALGRTGPVCPFVPKAVKEQGIYLTIINQEHLQKEKLYETILNYQQWFLTLPPSSGSKSVYRSIIMIINIKNVNLNHIVEKTIDDLKLSFVEKKLMLGEFHAGPPDKNGIRNPDFKPLKSPIPLLVIREMVDTDIEFLKENQDYLTYYQNFFPDNTLYIK